ncbi:MAG TPA: type VI secretion system tube protein Hcp [Acetobacteraceae bacterium]|nr:type VI secretion system tube protein Hcp [Acetobacteraceae bacterium]
MSAEEANRIARAAERLRRGTRLPLKVLVPTAVALGAGGALAAAAIPGSGGVITACYNTSTGSYAIQPSYLDGEITVPEYGTLRVIDPSAQSVTDANGNPSYNSSCAPDEQTITWNQQGVPGTNGTNGTNGADGKNGQNGFISGAATFEIDAGGGTELFAQLSQIAGTSKLDGQGGLIRLQSFAFGAESPVLGSSKGSGAGKAVQTFEFTKRNDKTNAELFQDWQQNRTIARMQVQAAHSSKGQTSPDASFTFSDVKLKSIQQQGGGETVIGVFTKMQSSFGTGTSKVEGSLNPGASTTWDLTTQKTS